MAPDNPNSRPRASRYRRPRRGNANGSAGRGNGPKETPPIQSNGPKPVPMDTGALAPMRFQDLAVGSLLDPILIQTVTENLGFEHMTPVQEATLPVLLRSRSDCLGQAKTGTGKTIAFLLPALQNMLKNQQVMARFISLLVITPTRELAMQIASEASLLLSRLPQYKVCLAIGGTNKDREEKEILNGCNIIIATPGRLNDHLTNQRIVAKLSRLNTLVLDEADRLLDMGFMNAIQDIIRCLSDKEQTKRQGMLFSATIGPQVEKFAHLALSPGYEIISTIPVGEPNIHERVRQFLITVPNFRSVLPATLNAIRSEMAADSPGFKAIVFAPTAALADWYAIALAHAPGLPTVSVIHSRLSQSKRTNVTNAFRDSTSAVIVATDVIARGMDFPNVSTVFQVGIPADRESYIHRLGRTARAGREGRGVFIVTEAEAFFPATRLKEINFVPIAPGSSPADEVVIQEAAIQADIQGKVYQAWLGYYKNHLKGLGWTPEYLVAEGNKYAIEALCAGGVPEMQKSTASKMGLKGVRGLNVISNAPYARGNREARPQRGHGKG